MLGTIPSTANIETQRGISVPVFSSLIYTLWCEMKSDVSAAVEAVGAGGGFITPCAAAGILCPAMSTTMRWPLPMVVLAALGVLLWASGPRAVRAEIRQVKFERISATKGNDMRCGAQCSQHDDCAGYMLVSRACHLIHDHDVHSVCSTNPQVGH
jgi:hypothetical protein